MELPSVDDSLIPSAYSSLQLRGERKVDEADAPIHRKKNEEMRSWKLEK